MAERIQLSRSKGWKKPEGAIVVSRPGRWGNPFTLEWVRLDAPDLTDREARILAVQFFTAWLTNDVYAASFPVGSLALRREWMLANLHALAGKDLCCWCPPPKEGGIDWCHAAVLSAVANGHQDIVAAVLELPRRGGSDV